MIIDTDADNFWVIRVEEPVDYGYRTIRNILFVGTGDEAHLEKCYREAKALDQHYVSIAKCKSRMKDIEATISNLKASLDSLDPVILGCINDKIKDLQSESYSLQYAVDDYEKRINRNWGLRYELERFYLEDFFDEIMFPRGYGATK
jgi:predicted RNase H-like nuclease (RuvC/YqgF family)